MPTEYYYDMDRGQYIADVLVNRKSGHCTCVVMCMCEHQFFEILQTLFMYAKINAGYCGLFKISKQKLQNKRSLQVIRELCVRANKTNNISNELNKYVKYII